MTSSMDLFFGLLSSGIRCTCRVSRPNIVGAFILVFMILLVVSLIIFFLLVHLLSVALVFVILVALVVFALVFLVLLVVSLIFLVLVHLLSVALVFLIPAALVVFALLFLMLIACGWASHGHSNTGRSCGGIFGSARASLSENAEFHRGRVHDTTAREL